jgi:polar amino acid transport system ATP-binding protein
MKLEVSDLQKVYGNQAALGPLNFSSTFQTLILIGPSGRGKSTLLRLLGGLQYPSSGSIVIDDEALVFKEKELLAHRRHLGFVFQSWNLFPHLTAIENIVLPLQRVHNLSYEESLERSFTYLKRFDMDTHAHKKPHALSGGQAQRIALIRAVAVQPKMLLLDEPTSALDPLMTSEVLDLILELKKEGQNLILATHHLHFAKKIADQILFLAEGRLLESGTAEDVFEHPTSDLARHYMSQVFI